VAKGSVDGFFFDPNINLWDLALPTLLLERTGNVIVYGSGRRVELSELMDRRVVPDAVFAGRPEMVDVLRQRITYTGKK
jgi:fructose-1,6-bisphosphatase/inositol monophosphatase family enzyme